MSGHTRHSRLIQNTVIHMKKSIYFVFILFFLTSCTSMGNSPNMTQNFQLITIDGESYFLDNRSGYIYKVKKNPDGTLDSSKKVGRVGL